MGTQSVIEARDGGRQGSTRWSLALVLGVSLLALALAAPGPIQWARMIINDPGSSQVNPGDRPSDWPTSLQLRPEADSYVEGIPSSLFLGSGPTTGDTPVSDLQVRVLGTDLTMKPGGTVEEAFAIIRDLETRAVEIYSVGMKIRDAMILRIQPNQVLVRRQDGSQETLRFLHAHQPEMAVGPPFGPGTPADSEPVNLSASGMAQEIFKPMGAFRRGLNREKALEYVDEVFSDLPALAQYSTGLKPVYMEDQLQGYELGGSLPQDMFQATGLRSGDIIRTLNSMDLDSHMPVNYLYKELVGNRLRYLVLGVDRAGSRTNLVFAVDDPDLVSYSP